MELVMPFVHPNGTTATDLLGEREVAYKALRLASEALRAMSPNGRDYYLEAGRFERAVAQHEKRVVAITLIMAELVAECRHIEDIDP